MKRLITFCVLAAAVGLAIARAARQAPSPPQPPLSRYIPAGSVLYLEAQDFSSLLSSWNSSEEKKRWLASGNYEVFSRSRLLLRLKAASDQFAAAAGIPPSMNFVSQVAGTRSALALYDIGNLEFLYITDLPAARSMKTTLWQARAQFDPRNADGVTFYVHRDPQSKKEVAFAVSGDYLLLATRDDLLASALAAISGAGERTIESESWWAQSVAAAGPSGDLRMVMNLEKIVPSPYFRSYWVQQNITEMKQYSAAISDLYRSRYEDREERVLLPRKRETAPPHESDPELEAASGLTRLVPQDAGFFEIQAAPALDDSLQRLESTLLAPLPVAVNTSENAPQVALTSGETGSSSDLETRIDQVTPARAETQTASVKRLLDQSSILATLRVQSTAPGSSGVFVRIHSAMVLVSASDWNATAVQSAIAGFIRPALAAGELGTGWQQQSDFVQLDGLFPLAVSVRGNYLCVSNDPALLQSLLAGLARKPEAGRAVFGAGFNHARERTNFARLSSLVDRSGASSLNEVAGMDREPQFFSGNISSLSATLASLSSERITVRREQEKVRQTVTYEWSR